MHGAPRCRMIGDCQAGQGLSLRDIGGEQGCARHEFPSHCVNGSVVEQAGAALGDHDRINDQRHASGLLTQQASYSMHHRCTAQHSGLDRISPDIAQHHGHLQAHELRRHRRNSMHAQGILRRERGDGGGGISAERRHGLDVCLDASAAARVGACNDKDAAAYRAGQATSRVAAKIVLQSSATMRSTIASSSPSAITRRTGSVPLMRSSSRPDSPNSASAAEMAAST